MPTTVRFSHERWPSDNEGFSSDDEEDDETSSWDSDLSSSSMSQEAPFEGSSAASNLTLANTEGAGRMPALLRAPPQRWSTIYENVQKDHPEEWERRITVPVTIFGAKVMCATAFAFFIYNRMGHTLLTLAKHCGAQTDSPPLIVLLWKAEGARAWAYYFVSLVFPLFIWQPHRVMYEVLVCVAMLAWQFRCIAHGTSYLCNLQIIINQCKIPEPGDKCPECSEFGYSVLLDVMIWVLLMPSVVLERTTMVWLLVIWLLCFWWMSFYSERRERNLVKYINANDAFVGLVFFVALSWLALRRKKQLIRQHVTKFSLDLEQALATQKMFNVLQFMVPDFVIAPLLRFGLVRIPRREQASVMFIMLEGLQMATHNPSDLLAFLNDSFTMFDEVCKEHSVTKIETFKEEYVCAVGVVPVDVEQGLVSGYDRILGRLLKAALDVLDKQHALQAALPAANGEASGAPQVVLKVGIHTGPLVAGIIGEKLPRFRLFGDTVNTAARMMQKGVHGMVQFGQETRNVLPRWAVAHVVERGQVEMKGKGSVTTYLLQTRAHGGSTWSSIRTTSTPMSAAARSRPPTQPLEPGTQTGVLKALMGSALRKTASLVSNQGTLRNFKKYVVASEFERVLQEMYTTHSDQRQPSGTRSGTFHMPPHQSVAGIWWSRVMWTLLGVWTDFPAEAEASFRLWFQKEKTCRGMEKRLLYQAAAVATLSFFEFVYLLFGSDFAEARDWAEAMEYLSIFVTCRCICVSTLLALRAAVQSDVKLVQAVLVGICWLVMSLLFISYDSLSTDLWGDQLVLNRSDCNPNYNANTPPACGVSQNVPLLVFFPVYCIAMTSYPFQFIYSLSFSVLTVVLVFGVHKIKGLGHLPLSVNGSYMISFALITALEAYFQEALFRDHFKASLTVEKFQNRINNTLKALIPPGVAAQLGDGSGAAQLVAHKYEVVTLAQSDLCGFTALASTLEPEDVVKLISELFGKFDHIADLYGVYKVETVGDAYIAGQGGYPLTDANSALAVVRFAASVVQETVAWSRRTGTNISCRAGVHTGSCVGGIVGTDMQRYHLFGKLTDCLEVLESTSHAGRVHVSRACKEAADALQPHEPSQDSRTVRFEPRTEDRLMTSKGEVHEFVEAGGRPTYFASL